MTYHQQMRLTTNFAHGHATSGAMPQLSLQPLPFPALDQRIWAASLYYLHLEGMMVDFRRLFKLLNYEKL